MIYTYRVTLEGIKGFFRVYKVNSTNSLYTFHKQIRSDLEFPMDQPILFKALDENGNVVARYALIDLGNGSVDMVSFADTIKAGAVKFVYFYDVTSKKSVTITFEGEEKGEIAGPAVIETKGPLPIDFENGYVAFEDLQEEQKRKAAALKNSEAPSFDPDDEDFDDEDDEDDEENEDKEEEEIIYDANE